MQLIATEIELTRASYRIIQLYVHKDLICCKNKYWLKGHKLQKAKVEAKELQEAQTDQVHALFGKVSKMLPFLKIQVQVKLKYF